MKCARLYRMKYTIILRKKIKRKNGVKLKKKEQKKKNQLKNSKISSNEN